MQRIQVIFNRSVNFPYEVLRFLFEVLCFLFEAGLSQKVGSQQCLYLLQSNIRNN